MSDLYHSLVGGTVGEVREVIRSGSYTGHTAGLAPGMLQANLAILPVSYADDFYRFCQANPQPCPLVGMSPTGAPHMPELGQAIDIRTDIPSYNVYRFAELEEKRADITDLWQEDFVAFALGCSFTFEHALQSAGIDLRHIRNNTTVPMYKTSIPLEEAGPFGGGMVVSMRPIPVEQVDKAYKVCRNYPHAHGEPVHVGDPKRIGIANLSAPDWGHVSEVRPGEVPVFWACGVTPQNAIQRARPPICITHTPGSMLIADVKETDRPDLEVRSNYERRLAS